MVRSTAEARSDAPERERMTRAPRKNSMPIVDVTKTQRIRHTSEKNSRTPSAKTTAPASNAIRSGQPKLRFKLSVEVLRQASKGPTPVRNKSSNPIGILTLLKNGAPTLMREPENHSEKTGNRVPDRTAMQETSKIRLLKRKLDSREIIASSWFSLLTHPRIFTY